MASRLSWATSSLIAGWVVFAACSANPDGSGRTAGPSSGTGGTGVTGPGGMGGGVVVGPGGVDPTDKRDVPIRKKVCDTAGKCTCLRLALLGTLQSAAQESDTRPFVDWLNNNSEGTASVTIVSSKPTLNAEYLNNYDILVVANISGWAFGAEEKAAVEAWVRGSGGGIITLTGFVSTAAEQLDSAQLTSFAGFKYQPPETGTDVGKASENLPVYYKGGSVNMRRCLHWSGSFSSHITAPIKFQPQMGQLAKLTLNLDQVGVFKGWSVAPPAGATVIGTDPLAATPVAVAHEVDGKGRIFAFGDEWVIFANQWVPIGNPDDQSKNTGNVCYHPADATSPEFFHSVQTLYQTKQFWFNAINWVAPPNECNFTVKDPDVVVR